jgi:hypothetical protein
MKSLKWSLLIISLFFFSGILRSQDTIKILDQVYGLDQTLHNGKKYDYIAPPGTSGNQYLSSNLFSVGTVTLKGKSYSDVNLNFDIFNQQLLLQYANDRGPMNIIEVSKAWLKGFSLGDRNFELLPSGKIPGFYQVLGEGQVRVLYFWRKTLELNNAIGSNNYVFSTPIRDSYVLLNGELKLFTNKRNLIRLFDPKYRSEIKNYLRKNKVKVKKASDKAMAEMITFIGNLK